MTIAQMTAFAIVIGMMAMFVWGRIRYDLVALLALFLSLSLGIVAPEDAFTGFSDDIVIIVASALVTSAAVSRSGITDAVVKRLTRFLPTADAQVAALGGTVLVVSGFVKNIGALSMLIPPTFQIARKTGTPVSRLLMPMSFASLLGGVVTLVGTSPNIIVSRLREDITGVPFRMFDFAPVGVPLALAGLIFLVFGHRLLPARRGPQEGAFNIKGYTTEAIVPETSVIVGRPVSAVVDLAGGDVTVTALVRNTHKRFRNPSGQIVRPDDLLILEGDSKELEQIVVAAGLKIANAADAAALPDPEDEIGVMEAVVTAGSMMIDWSPEQLRLSERFNVTMLAVSRSGERVAQRLKSFRFRAGDVVVMQGNLRLLPEVLGQLGCLPLAQREVQIGQARHRWLPVAVLAIAMVMMALGLVTVTVAFFSAAVTVVLLGALSAREAYRALDAPVLVTLACLIPVSEAMQSTGATGLIAEWLSMATAGLSPQLALALIMVTAMAVTPFLNNAATVLVAGPIAAGLATRLGFGPDPFLMAVALGAACDFLTPIGHQCNMLVMGPGGYRFGDYWRLGLPLSVLVVIVGVPLIAFFWPLAPG